MVWRPDRFSDLVCALDAASLMPKRVVTVYNDPYHSPCLMLIEARKGVGKGTLISLTEVPHCQFMMCARFLLGCNRSGRDPGLDISPVSEYCASVTAPPGSVPACVRPSRLRDRFLPALNDGRRSR